MKKPRTYKQLQQDPRVMGAFAGGLRIFLTPGWVTGDGLITFRADTVAESCDCVSCASYSPREWADAIDPLKEQPASLLPGG